MLFDVAMRIWIAMATLVCVVCDGIDLCRMTQSMLSDKLRHGHICQGCVDDLILIHSRLH